MKRNFLITLILCLWVGGLPVNGEAETDADKLGKPSDQLSVDDPDSHYYRGWAYIKKVRYPEAVREFQKAIEIKPAFAEAHYALGLVYEKLEKGKSAIIHTKKARELFLIENNKALFDQASEKIDDFYKKFGLKPEDIKSSK